MGESKSNARDRAEAGETVDARFHNAVHDADEDSPMNKAEAVKEILDEMRDNIVDEILQATRQIERLDVPDAENARLLADQLLDVIMDWFPEGFPELHSRARAMYEANGGKVPTSV